MPRVCRWVAIPFILLAALLPAQDAEGRKVALLVGVKDYKGTDLASLKYTENDVEEFAKILKANGFRRVTLLTQSEAFAKKNDDFFPTAENVRDALKITLADRNPNDTVLIAFAGHGVQLREPAGMYFCPQKADLGDPKSLVALDEVYAALKECKAGTRLLVVDACRNDPTAGRSATVANLASVSRPELPRPPGGVAALFSCSTGERAFESDKLKHGVFFHHLIEGMKGKAAAKNGEVDLLGLAQYVMAEVPETTHDEFGLKANQRPHLLSDVQRVMLAKTAPAELVRPAPPRDEPAPVAVRAKPVALTPPPAVVALPATADVFLPDYTALAYGINLGDLVGPLQQAIAAGPLAQLQTNGVTNLRAMHGACVKLADGSFPMLTILECNFDVSAYARANPNATVLDRPLGIIREPGNNGPTVVAPLPGVGVLMTTQDALPLMRNHLARTASRRPATLLPEFRAVYDAADKSKPLWAVGRFEASTSTPQAAANIVSRSSVFNAWVQLQPQPLVRITVSIKDGENLNQATAAIRAESEKLLDSIWTMTRQSGNVPLHTLYNSLVATRRYDLVGRDFVLSATVDAATWQRLTAGQ